MQLFLTVLVWSAALLIGVITATANFQYGWMIGHGLERYVFAVGATVLDVVKTFLPTLIGTFLVGGLTLGTFFRHAVGWSLWGLGVALSLWCAQGLYAASLDAKNAEVAGAKSDYSQLTTDKVAKEARLGVLAGTKSKEALAGEIAAQKLDRLWSRTQECSDATAPESRSFCQTLRKLEAALSTAPAARDTEQEAAKIRGELAVIETKISAVDQAELHVDASAGPKAQAKLLGWSVDFTTAVLALLVALGFECTALLPWIILGSHGPQPPPAQRGNVTAPRDTLPAVDEIAAPAQPASDAMSIEESSAGRWAQSAVTRRRNSFVPACDVRNEFEAYCRAHGELVMNPTAFGKEMTRLGFKRRKIGGKLRYVDIALLPMHRELKVVASNPHP